MLSHVSSTKSENADDGKPLLGYDTLMNPITGVPIPAADQNENILDFAPQFMVDLDSLDFGEFHDGAADVQANSFLNATCGILSKKYVMTKPITLLCCLCWCMCVGRGVCKSGLH